MIVQKIKSDQLQARKEKNKELASILTALYSEVAIVGKNNGNRETTDEEAVKVIKKFSKGVLESIETLQGSHNWENCGGRIEDLQNELDVYEKYLPKQMSENELRTAIEVMVSGGKNNIGMIMGTLKKEYAGLYDGAMASKLAKEILS